MSRLFHGVLSCFLIMAFIAIGMIASYQQSVLYASLYLAVSLVGFAALLVAYCAKCPGKTSCAHIFPGLIARHIDRKQTPYTKFEYAVTVASFGLLLTFPLPALLKNTTLLLAFCGSAILAAVEILMTVCGGCRNVFCPVKRIAFTGNIKLHL